MISSLNSIDSKYSLISDVKAVKIVELKKLGFVVMVTIRCIRCKRKIFKYEKIGKGRIWHCWEHRIKEDFSMRKGTEIRCSCGNLIGITEKKWIKMKQNAFEFSGTVTKR